jgi:outer membrane receptor for Fe3+-dicitrate
MSFLVVKVKANCGSQLHQSLLQPGKQDKTIALHSQFVWDKVEGGKENKSLELKDLYGETRYIHCL